MLWMRSSISVFDVLTVVNAVFIVLICHLMNYFHSGYNGDAMVFMCCAAMNCAKTSGANEGPLSLNNHLGCPYCENISWNLLRWLL